MAEFEGLSPAQTAKLEKIKKEFPSAGKKGYLLDKRTGIMRVRLQAVAGEWTWYFNRAGELIDMNLTQRLVDVPAETSKPRNAIDN